MDIEIYFLGRYFYESGKKIIDKRTNFNKKFKKLGFIRIVPAPILSIVENFCRSFNNQGVSSGTFAEKTF